MWKVESSQLGYQSDVLKFTLSNSRMCIRLYSFKKNTHTRTHKYTHKQKAKETKKDKRISVGNLMG